MKKKRVERGPATKASVTRRSSDRVVRAMPVLLILVFSFLVYFNALFGDFVYDDKFQIVDNPWIRDVVNIPTIFSKNVWSFHPVFNTSNYYRPLMHVIYMLDYYLFGLKPWGFHLVDILFHCGASVLVFLIMRRLLADHEVTTSPAYLSPPLIAAMLFASHPIHTESVAWIAGLPDVAFTFFYLLSLYLYILFRDGSRRLYPLSVLSFSAAIFFKEPALTLPVMLIACDWWLKKGDESIFSGVKRYIPYGAVSGVYLLVRFYALKGFSPTEFYPGMGTDQLVMNVFPLFREYLTGLIWPINLNFWHTFHPIASLFGAGGMISLIITVVFLIGMAAALRKNKILFISLLLLLVPLLPAFYIKGISGKPFAERYLYLPSAGFVFILAVFLSWTREKLPRAAAGVTIAAIVILGLYTIGTISRNNVWKDNFSLWSDTVRKAPDSAEAHNDLGSAYASRGQLDMAMEEYRTALRLNPGLAAAHNNIGNKYAAKGQLDAAIGEFQIVLRLKPDNAEAHNNLGTAYASQGKTDMAVAEFRTALRLKPNYTEAHDNLGNAYASRGRIETAIAEYRNALRLKPDDAEAHYNLGNIYASQGKMDLAMAEYRNALHLKPDDAIAHNNLGNAYASQGQMDLATEEYRIATRLKPDYAMAHQNLGSAYASKGQMDTAMAEYRIALRLNPDYPDVHNNIGVAYASKGQMDTAIAEYRIALRLNPDYAKAHNNLGIAYGLQGKMDMAVAEFRNALRLKPDYAEAHYNLGNAYASQGRMDMAIAEYRNALRLKPDYAKAHYNLALLYSGKGDKDEARREAEMSLKISPDLDEARRLLSEISRQR